MNPTLLSQLVEDHRSELQRASARGDAASRGQGRRPNRIARDVGILLTRIGQRLAGPDESGRPPALRPPTRQVVSTPS